MDEPVYQNELYEDVARTLAMFSGTALMEPRKVRDAIACSLAALFLATDNPSCPTCFDHTCSVHDKPSGGFDREQFLEACGVKEQPTVQARG